MSKQNDSGPAAYPNVLAHLSEWRDQVVQELRTVDEKDRQSALLIKREIDEAIACLQLCARNGITARSKVTPVPIFQGYCNYHVLVEGDWMKSRLEWRELGADGRLLDPDAHDPDAFDLFHGDLIVRTEAR